MLASIVLEGFVVSKEIRRNLGTTFKIGSFKNRDTHDSRDYIHVAANYQDLSAGGKPGYSWFSVFKSQSSKNQREIGLRQ